MGTSSLIRVSAFNFSLLQSISSITAKLIFLKNSFEHINLFLKIFQYLLIPYRRKQTKKQNTQKNKSSFPMWPTTHCSHFLYYNSFMQSCLEGFTYTVLYHWLSQCHRYKVSPFLEILLTCYLLHKAFHNHFGRKPFFHPLQ